MTITPDDLNILALIPAFNEAAAITSVVRATLAYLPVLVVDDGSKDATAALAEKAGATVARQVPNQGKGAALRKGFEYAIQHGYEAVLTLDADGQHDPKEIPAFLQAYRDRHAELIIGARQYSQMPTIRRMSNTLGRWMLSRSLGAPLPDNQSGYRLVHKTLAEAMLPSQEKNFEFEVEMVAVCLRLGMKLDWIPIRTIYAGEKSHIKPLRHVVNFLRVTWKFRHP